ncbi:glycosyltransferase family 2 protein [Cyanobacteria bacterium FACHB-DQ100]|nr:glycosyltransferase family 2 protein [Cyanobacteria bacterium FACHB-DQ100]
MIIPAYNAEKTIRETIESVLNQTFKDFEVVVVNDGATDKTLEIVQSICDPRIKVFSYVNSGKSLARNRGIELSKGEYLSFLDADDLWTPDKLEEQWKALQNHPEADVTYSWTNFIDGAGNLRYQGARYGNAENIYRKLLVKNCFGSGSNILVRRSAIAQMSFHFDPSLPNAEDWDFYIRLAAQFKFVCVPKYQILYRTHNGSSSFNIQASEAACLKIIDRAFKQAPDSLRYLRKDTLAALYTYYAHRVLANPSKRSNAVSAFRYLRLAVHHDSVAPQTILRLLLKIFIVLLLPVPLSRMMIKKLSQRDSSQNFRPNKTSNLTQLKMAIGKALIIAYKESTQQLEEALTSEGFCCEVVRQEDKPEYQDFASIHRCMLNHRQAWEKAAQASHPTLIVESDFVPVVGMGSLSAPFNLDQKNVGIAWLYTCAPQLYSVTPEGYGEGFSTALVAYVVTPEGAKSLCESFVEEITEKYGASYHNFDSQIDNYLRRKGFKNYIPFRNYGEHGGKSNPEHRRNGMSGIHHADLLYGKLAFLPPFLVDQANPQLKLIHVRSKARLKGMARLLLGKYLRPAIVRRSSTPFRLIKFAVSRHFQAH